MLIIRRMVLIVSIAICAASIAMLQIIGCSHGGQNPVITENNPDLPYPPVVDIGMDNNSVLGKWKVVFEPGSLTPTITPIRQTEAHYNVKPFIPNPIIQIINYDPVRGVMDVDITIKNPFAIDAYDMRLIIFTDDFGVRLLNPDAWTALFDVPGGGNVNPFKAYAKDEVNRKFKKQSQYTERVQLYLPSGAMTISFAIDASYPKNCDEPYSISNFTQIDELTEFGGSATVRVDVLDWQNDVDSVSLNCPLITGVSLIPFTQINSKTWEATIVNNANAMRGDYIGYIIAKSSNSGQVALYDDVLITVTKAIGWARTWGSNAGGDYVDEVAKDKYGNMYGAGQFEGTVDFDPDSGTDIHSSNGTCDAFLCKYDTNGKFLWCLTWGGPTDDTCYTVMVDNGNYVYCGGMFSNSVDFDPGPGTDMHSSNGGYDAYLVKFDSNGNYIWARTWGGPEDDSAHNIDFDNEGNVYIAGQFRNITDFDPGSLTDNHQSNGDCDSFINKFDSSGNHVWAVTWGGTGSDSCNGFVIDYSNNIYASGWFSNSVDFDPGPDPAIRISNGMHDAFLTRFSTNGIFVWNRTWGGTDNDESHCMAIDRDSNVIAGSYFRNTVNFNPSGSDVHSSNGGYDAAFSKFDTNGNFLFARTFGGSSDDQTFQVSSDQSGNIYISGFIRGIVDLNPGLGSDMHMANNMDAFLSMFTSSGGFIWGRSWGGSGDDFASGLPKDCTNIIYVSGRYTDTTDFDPGPKYDWHTSNGYEDAFVMKLLVNGYWE